MIKTVFRGDILEKKHFAEKIFIFCLDKNPEIAYSRVLWRVGVNAPAANDISQYRKR